ncbi:MAG TPA: hypothetical protein VHN79_03305 [Lacunisphaera sp.]|nr:hypothetical protein [Lacunisphaera sp.]
MLPLAAEEIAADISVHGVGVTQRAFSDPDRTNWAGDGPRMVRVTLWYPGDTGGFEEVAEADGLRLILHRESEIARFRERHPLVMLSHGSGGNAAQVGWLGAHLAEHGFIVAALEHNGTDEEELHRRRPTLTDFFGWERARDVSVALDGLLADPRVGPRIDAARIGAAGFSLGGTTALWTAGARLELERLRTRSPPPPPGIAEAIASLIAFAGTDPVARRSVARSDLSHKDARIRAVFALAPPMGAGFTAAGLRTVDVPVLIVVGDADLVAPPETNARHFAAHIPTARLEVVSGERGHYLKPIATAQRQAELHEVARMARAFFEAELR